MASDNGAAWLELTFARPAHAREVRVRQTNASGSLVRVETMESEGTSHWWWQGTDPFVEPAVREIAWFAVRGPETSHRVARKKISLALAGLQLVGTPE